MPLLLALWTLKSKKRKYLRGFGLGYLSGLIFFLINLSWLHHIHFIACLLLSFFLAGYFAIWGGFAATIGVPKKDVSTLAESNLYRSWKADVIGMTNMPEAKLAREAEIRYASV